MRSRSEAQAVVEAPATPLWETVAAAGGVTHACSPCAARLKNAEPLNVLGAEHAFNYSGTTPEKAVSTATDGRGFEIVYNTPGAPSIDHAVAVAAFGGTILDILGAFPVQPGFQMNWLCFHSVFAGRPALTGEGTTRTGEILRDRVALRGRRHRPPDRRATVHLRPRGRCACARRARSPDRQGRAASPGPPRLSRAIRCLFVKPLKQWRPI